MGLWLPKRRVRLYKGRGSSVALKVMFATVGLFNLKKKKKGTGYMKQGDETVSLIFFIFVEEEVLLERFSHQQVNGLLQSATPF